MGTLLALIANDIRDSEYTSQVHTFCLFCPSLSDKDKRFYDIDTNRQYYETFYPL
jgi:hypothetical protein